MSEVPDETKQYLIPSQLKPTTKARERAEEIYSSLADKESVRKFAWGFADCFFIRDRQDRPVRMTWEVFFGCLSYQEIWDLVGDEFKIPGQQVPEEKDDFSWLDVEFDAI